MKQVKYILFGLIFVFSAASLKAQELFMTSIAPLTELAESIPEDFKIKPTGGTASSSQSGEDITKAFDGNYSTIYHSDWGGTTSPVTLKFTFDEADLNYLIYYPRTSGTNGIFKKLKIFYETATSGKKVELGEYDFRGNTAATRVEFPSTLEKVKYVEFSVETTVNDNSGKFFASCAEMEFYQKNPAIEADIEIFADKLLTSLKPGVTMADIDKMGNAYFRELAQTIYNGGYSTEFRTRECFPYMDRESMEAKYHVKAYNLYENPTGIYFPVGKNVIIVEGKAENLALAIPHYLGGSSATGDWGLKAKTYPLQEGVNVVDVAEWGGIGYISYFTPKWETANSVKIHVPKGIVQGYFDASIHTNDDFKRILANANAYPFMDLVGERIQITYKVDAYRSYTGGKAKELVANYDTMISWEQRYMGWEKHLTIPKNRVHCRANQSYFMYKDDTGASFEHGTMSYMANATAFYKDNWGACHETGHIHQFKFNNWHGMGEVSVNFPNIVFNRQVINPTDKDTKGDYQKAYNSIAKKNASTVTIPFLKYTKDEYNGTIDHNFGRLIAFAQLYHYFLEIGNEEFYYDLNEALRNTTEDTSSWGPADYEFNFAKKACEVSKLNLVPFFEKWGMLYYTDEDGRSTFSVGDYGSPQIYKLPKAKVDALKAYVLSEGYATPAQDITLVKPNGARITP